MKLINVHEKYVHLCFVTFHLIPQPWHFLHTLLVRSTISPVMFAGLRAWSELGFTSPCPLQGLQVVQNFVMR